MCLPVFTGARAQLEPHTSVRVGPMFDWTNAAGDMTEDPVNIREGSAEVRRHRYTIYSRVDMTVRGHNRSAMGVELRSARQDVIYATTTMWQYMIDQNISPLDLPC